MPHGKRFDRSAKLGPALIGLGALAAVAGAAVFLLPSAGRPHRCASGMTDHDTRCCGEGQRAIDGSCTGTATRCAHGLVIAEGHCQPPAHSPIRIEGGVLDVGPSDWEAQGIVEPRRVDVGSFFLDRYETTVAQYQSCVRAERCASPVEASTEPARPVRFVTFEEAAAYCAFAGGRLPTVDEHAFAMSGGGRFRYPWGQTGAVCRRAVWGRVDGPCGDRASGPDVVGSLPDGHNEAGFADLAGNVAEWCAGEANGDEGDATHAHVRGGSFKDAAAAALRAWSKRRLPRNTRADDIGFRCAYDQLQPETAREIREY